MDADSGNGRSLSAIRGGAILPGRGRLLRGRRPPVRSLPMFSRILAVLSLVLICGLSGRAAGAAAPFLDPKLPVDVRVADLMGRLSIEEKAILLNHRGPTITVEGHAIRSDQWNQCLNGVQWDRPTTLFPICLAMAATWNPELVEKDIARVISDEARAIYNRWRIDPGAPGQHKGLIYRDPVINIGRNPYWGRNHEAFGEDPFLTGRMGVAYTRGIQGDHPRYLKLAATLKHYAVNNVEGGRMELSAEVPERMLREYWLPHFREAVVEGGAQSLMASYNAINGTPNNINHWLLTEVLKEQWQHPGFVVSDLGGVRTMVEGHEQGGMSYVDAVAQSLMAGCDFSDREFQEHIPAAVEQGKLSPERLDDALARVLRTRFRLGEFDPFEMVPYSTISDAVIDSPAHRLVALEAARQGIVLLQNRGGLLPLDRSGLSQLAVIGPLADRVVRNNYNGRHVDLVSGLAGIRELAGEGIELRHAPGATLHGNGRSPATQVDREGGFSGGRSIKLLASSEGAFIEFPIEVTQAGEYELELRYKSFADRGTFQASIGGRDLGEPVDMFGNGRYGLNAELGEVELPAGSSTIRFTAVGHNQASAGHTGHFDRLSLGGADDLEFELERLEATTGWAEGVGDPIEEAVALAGSSDAAIVFVGTDESIEQEGRDRNSLGLPGDQEELVLAVLAANPRTIVVQKSAGPLTVPRLKEKVPAMLQAWWTGGQGGTAIAEVLFGEVNPAGRLPHTVYASEEQVPSIDEYDIGKGFTYMYLKDEALFPFGHGLSYTSFDYADLDAPNEEVSAGSVARVMVELTNSGSRPGDEVVQLYVHKPDSAVSRPQRQLQAFRRVPLQPGETKTVALEVDTRRLAYWNAGDDRWVIEPGKYELMVGASSSDIRATGSFTVSR